MLVKFLDGTSREIANLSGANLSGANLISADLRCANLSGANLRFADLISADLRSANLISADLRSANLISADLRSANLYGASLYGASLSGALIDQATKWPAFQIPQTGSLTVWKKLRHDVIAELLVGKNTPRTASLVGRKCRAAYVKVLALHNLPDGQTEGWSSHDHKTLYRVGCRVKADSYNPDPKVECTNGIHFFLTEQEALDY